MHQHRDEMGRRIFRPQYGCGVFLWGTGGCHAPAVSAAVLAATVRGIPRKEKPEQAVKVDVLEVVPDCLRIKAVMFGEWKAEGDVEFAKVL